MNIKKLLYTKKCARNAVKLLDPRGGLRRVRTFLVVYIADLPEQQNVAGVTSGYAPSSTAGPTTLGSPTPHPLWRGKDTLDAIRAINEEIEALGVQGESVGRLSPLMSITSCISTSQIADTA